MITVYSTTWCGDCIRSKAFLDENGVEYKEIDIENDEKAMEQVKKINHGNASVPTIILEDGSILVEPSNQELAKKLELESIQN